MQLNLKNPLVFFDLETTGINISTDRIVEISYLKVFPDGREESKTMRINPGRPIPPEATAVHKITDADVADCPTFKEVAKTIAADLEGCDLAGYNSNRFDVPLLVEELLRAGVSIDISLRMRPRPIHEPLMRCSKRSSTVIRNSKTMWPPWPILRPIPAMSIWPGVSFTTSRG